MLLHFIGNSDVPDFNNPWIEKYIFPGGHIPSLSEFTPAIERSGLVVTDIEVLRLHYASTLRIWRERFLARRAEAVALYDERFARMWEYYLSMSETAFRYQDIAIFQVQLARRQESVPLTRDYVGEREARLREAEARAVLPGLTPSGT
jgi:cyclopropane-fatty-acyl-phospholipid synthase